MAFTLDEIKKDLLTCSDKDFYTKHIVKSNNWYFEKVLGKNTDDLIKLYDETKIIISESFGISFNSIMMTGSGKIGYSLSEHKLFKPFNYDDKIGKLSDLDFAIISNSIFDEYWRLFRTSFKLKYKTIYENHIFREIYRGYINERNILEVEGCRKQWNETAAKSKSKLYSTMYIKNEISYRIYRSWEDFEDYNLHTIHNIARGGIIK